MYKEDNLLVGEYKGAWSFPNDSVLVKTLFLDLALSSATTSPGPEPVETQILHRDRGVWRGYSYIWNESHTDAILVPAQGAERVFRVADRTSPGGSRQQTWRFLGRNDCIVCHVRHRPVRCWESMWGNSSETTIMGA